jgi:ABC-type molybdenum transport system ATPase subunit/photorepair protein PhrA
VVDKLFGFLSYEISTRSKEGLIILYGDNGSGKTTILNLIFHALSPESAKGHRTFIARVPFKRLEIRFADGHCVSAFREEASSGPFAMRVAKGAKEIASHNFTIDPDGRVRDRDQDESTYRPLLDALEHLQLELFLLPDHRRIESTLDDDEEDPRRRPLRQREAFLDEESTQETIDSFVQQALSRAQHWTRRQALAATSQGETDTNKIYADILRTIVGPTQKNKAPPRVKFAELLEKAEALHKRSLTFSRFGLATPLGIKDLRPVLERAAPSKKGAITKILSPYIRSVEARLDALENLREAMETFTDIFSRFYNYKSVRFHVRRGISINLVHGSSRLAPKVLSSGEKQLLLLFCNVLLARSRPSVFIIDEPELSLNIKWQRELISSLMSCVKGSDVQFLFATHSLEMISLHERSAVKLETLE